MLAFLYDLHPIDEHVIDTLRIGVDAKLIARYVIPVIARTAADRLGIEDHEIGVIAERDPSALDQAVVPRGTIRDLMHGLLQGDHPMLTHALLEQGGREGESVDEIEMRAGIGSADHGPVIVP